MNFTCKKLTNQNRHVHRLFLVENNHENSILTNLVHKTLTNMLSKVNCSNIIRLSVNLQHRRPNLALCMHVERGVEMKSLSPLLFYIYRRLYVISAP